MEGHYWTLGPYDGVLVMSADEAKKAVHCLAELTAYGNVSIQTLTAFEDTGFAAIVEN
ncbi:MAG: GYD domain-containing protein [Verrucomicrobiota bacterium]|nr:GYD domain-containing protein [Verrucomicrobiota bacterium]